MANSKLERNKAKEQEPEVRAHNFDEVSQGYNYETAQLEACRCLDCKNAPCKKGCPVAVQIPEFIAKIKQGDILGAGKIINQSNSLPSICGRVCPQESQCEKLCIRGKMEGAVAIGTLERFVGDYILNNAVKPDDKLAVPKIGKKVAVIGSGPAGLTCASELIASGVDVTIFEAFHRAGGVLVYGIPEFRLPKNLVQAEIDKLLERGVKLELNTVAGKTVTIEELKQQFDAIFIGSGAGLPQFMGIKGENFNGVYSANEYLTRVNLMRAYEDDSSTPLQRGKNVAVIGAGNVAMDSARTAIRLGADKVSIVYRRGRDEMPARHEEIEHALQEGIKLELLTNPIEVVGSDGWVTGLKCVRMELGEKDASGRAAPVTIVGSEFILDADLVVVALGTSPNPLIKNSFSALKTSGKGTLIVNEDMLTSVENIYAGGDAVTGAATVILAMGAGRTASQTILNNFNITK